MSRTLPLLLLMLIVTACGVQRPLMPPKDIPAFKEEQRKKKEKIDEERREAEQEAAARKAAQEKANPALTEPTK